MRLIILLLFKLFPKSEQFVSFKYRIILTTIMKIVSACLAGMNCRYDGGSNPCEYVIDVVRKGEAIPICPEQLGGLTTPRPPAEQKDNKVLTVNGEDVTAAFEKGAEEGLNLAKLVCCDEAILKARSPSCGSGKVYNGTFSKTLTDGDGVFAGLLKKYGIRVKTEEDF